MNFSSFSVGRMLSLGVAALGAVGLSGCFDLEQRVGLHRDGSGHYAVVVAADGIVGEGLRKDRHGHDRIDFDDGDDDNSVTRVSRKGDTTVQTTDHAFRDLSDLKLGDETFSLHVKGTNSEGEAQVNFHGSLRVDEARHHRNDDGDMGREVLQSMFGGHTYKFAVWLPGRIEHVAPVRVAGRTVHPAVWSDRTGHTVVWQMELPDMMLADRLDFSVDFAAKGAFHDAQSKAGVRHIRHRHHRHDDWDYDDDDDGKDRT